MPAEAAVRVLLVSTVLLSAAFYGESEGVRVFVQGYPYPPTVAWTSVSAGGRFVAFESLARLVPMDTNRVSDIYLLNTESGALELVSVRPDGSLGNESASTPRLSADGRYVVFDAVIPRPEEPCVTVFVRDREHRTTRALAKAWDDPSRIVCATHPAISSNGEWVVFESNAQNLVEGADANGSRSDVYLLHEASGHAVRVSVMSDGTQSPAGSSYAASVSGTGRLVAFTSTACLDPQSSSPSVRSLVGPCKPQVYVRDLATGMTRGIRAPGGGAPNGSTYSPALSADGRCVSFVSTATNLAHGDANERPDVYVCDLATGRIELLSRTERGNAGNGASSRPAISETGRFVAFDSTASDLICSRRCQPRDLDYNLVSDVFLVDRERGRIRRLSQDVAGLPWWEPSIAPALDAAGRFVAFSSRHARDATEVRTNFDLFVRALHGE